MIRGIKKQGALPVDGYDFGYGYDGTGYRRSVTRGGESNPHVAHVFVEAEPGVSSVEADVPQGNATARVNGIRQGNPLKLPVGWGNRVEFRSIRANGVGQPEFLRTLKQPVSVPEVRWTHIWDAQDRLTAMETDPAEVSKGAERRRLEFVYDARGRRVVKRVRSGWTGLAYGRVEERRFVYDEGWNVLGETVSVNGAVPVLDRRYVWGLDLSGTETGAGGVHGLVAAVRPGAPAGARRELPVYDGNGNVERVVTESGEVSARYEYGPFGEEITRRGVGAQPFRFSTKYHDEETGLLYYGYRYYNPRWGRWLSKDPIGERGGVNLYGMVGNDPLNYVDCLGLERRACPCDTKAVNQKAREFTDKAVQMTKDDEKNLPKNAIKPPSTGREFGGRICCNKKTGDVSGTGPIPGTWKTLAGPIWVGEEVDPKKAPACTTLGSDWEDAGFYHTHPSGSTGFSGSGGDVTWMWSNGGYPNFLGRMTGDPLRMDPKMTLYTDQYGTNPIKWGEVNSIGPDGSETPVSFPPRLTP